MSMSVLTYLILAITIIHKGDGIIHCNNECFNQLSINNVIMVLKTIRKN